MKIKEIRNKKGLTLDELAKKSGVSKRTISAYEAGETDVSFRRLQKIAKALEVPILELIEDEEGVFGESKPIFSKTTKLDEEGDKLLQKKITELGEVIRYLGEAGEYQSNTSLSQGEQIKSLYQAIQKLSKLVEGGTDLGD